MNWERLTSPDFEQAVKDCEGVCVLPIGVVEKHGDHLPLGQDTLYIHRVCTLAAEEEKAVVFPFYYFGQIAEAKHVPGTICVRSDFVLPLLENMCDEISRNGFKKILIVNGHGGNISMLNYFLLTLLDKPKDYMVFVSGFFRDEAVVKASEAKVDGHGGEGETCGLMYLFPELVKLERFADYGSKPTGRYQPYYDKGLETGIWWYAQVPEHLLGEKVGFTKEKGEVFVKSRVKRIAEQVKFLKTEEKIPELYREYLERSKKPANRT